MAQETPESPGCSGRQNTGAAIPIVFFHGQPGFGSDFDPVRRLLGYPFLVLAPDRPGYGENPLPATSMQANADWFAAQLETASASHDIGPAILVGHSFGGGIAALLAAERPDLVAGVVLAASVGSGEHLGALDRALATPVLGEVLFAGGLGAAGTVLPFIRSRSAIAPDRIARWLSVSLPDRGFLRETSRVTRVWRSVVDEQRALFKEIANVESAIPRLLCPVDVVAGTWDIVVPPSVGARIAASIPGAQLLIVARTGHFLTRDAPAVLAGAVRRLAVESGVLAVPPVSRT
jgi:pimeloyl-ACP methyl ester carboxylesterase